MRNVLCLQLARSSEELAEMAVQLHKLLKRMKFEVVTLNANQQA